MCEHDPNSFFLNISIIDMPQVPGLLILFFKKKSNQQELSSFRILKMKIIE